MRSTVEGRFVRIRQTNSWVVLLHALHELPIHSKKNKHSPSVLLSVTTVASASARTGSGATSSATDGGGVGEESIA